MTRPTWLTPELIKAAERVELDHHHDREDLPRGVLRVTLPAEGQEQPFVFRFTPRLTTGCRLQFNVELNGEVVGANLDADEVRAVYVEAEQRVFEDRNRERAGVDARRGELIGAAEQAIRARRLQPASEL
jgi:hypothetical protein